MYLLKLSSNGGCNMTNDKFEELNVIHGAIKDIDRLCSEANTNKESLLDDILFAVRDIDKSKYDDKYTDTLIKTIRAALVDIYSEKIREVNNDIDVIS